jgi:hypothetical protein
MSVSCQILTCVDAVYPTRHEEIEAARPAPRIFFDWNADPVSDRADADIAVIDVPAFVLGFEIAAAGEGEHAPMVPPIAPQGKPLQVGLGTGRPAAGRGCGKVGRQTQVIVEGV